MVVTGGGRGIGEATARALAEAGARVVVVARGAAEIELVAAKLAAAGHEVAAIACDVADPAAVERLRAAALERLGTVEILVNSAGVASSAPLKGQTIEEWRRLFAINVEGTFLTSRAFLPGMLERGWGRIVNVASVAGRTGAPYLSAYAASKHAVVGFTRALAAEVAARGVTVNAVCPGYVATPMTERSIENIVARTGLSAEEARRRLVAANPQGRLIEPEEVAFVVQALCDERARGINGQAIGVDGGAFPG
ncbi:MAG: D-beta-hydroxybutyrate dehydrogenase [Acidobacteria bacterium]|nr:D-beta-hydroxybutyrate dehydrogenase [Acidobacteriota bacterium]